MSDLTPDHPFVRAIAEEARRVKEYADRCRARREDPIWDQLAELPIGVDVVKAIHVHPEDYDALVRGAPSPEGFSVEGKPSLQYIGVPVYKSRFVPKGDPLILRESDEA